MIDWSDEPGVRTITGDGFVLEMTTAGVRLPVCRGCDTVMARIGGGPTCARCGGRFPQAARRA